MKIMEERLHPPPAPPAGELETILTQIENALDLQLYYLALVVTLSLPDICGGLLDPTGRATGANYKAWYDAHLLPTYPQLSADHCYSLRCGVLHQGRSEIVGSGGAQTRVLFKIPDPGFNSIQAQMPGLIMLEVAVFCDTVIDRVRAWYVAAQHNPNVIKNIPNVVRLRPQGYLPMIQGAAVIA